MKKILFLTILLPTLMFTAACSSDNEKDTVNALISTSWKCEEETVEHEKKEFENFDNKHFLDDILKICPSLKYEVGEKIVSEHTDEIDLCEKNGHGNHTNAYLDFNTDNCTLTEKTFNHTQVVEITIETTDYKFEEGSYIGAIGPSQYVGIEVRNSGIYQATTSGYKVVLPFSENFVYPLIKREYSSTEKIHEISNKKDILSFTVKNKNISISNNKTSWDGLLNSTNTELMLSNKVSSYKFMKK